MWFLDSILFNLAGGLVSLAILSVVHRLWFSPLSKLPGPAICALTRLPLMHHEFRGGRTRFIHALHISYGPVVRVAPDEVSFASADAVKEIYSSGGGGYDKSSFYSLFQQFGTPNMFSTLGRGEHSERKRKFAERYSKSHVMSTDAAAVIQDHVNDFSAKLEEHIGRSVDIYDWLHCFSLDSVAGHLFHPRDLHSLTDETDHKIMVELTYSSTLKSFYAQHYFPIMSRIWSTLMGKSFRRTDGLAAPYCLSVVREASVSSHTVLSKLRSVYASAPSQDVDGDSKSTPPDADLMSIASECMDHFAAAIDTTGDALCCLMHHLSLPTPASRAVQARLRAELAAHTGAAPDTLPYLDAVVREGLRVFAPIPMSLPRVVPAGGRVVAGAWLPAGTVVSCQPHTLHRFDEGVFPDPEVFRAERWLEEEGRAEREQLFFAFGAGGRGCIGKHLALLEMKMLLAEVYSRFITKVAPDMTASMDQDDQIIASRPRDQKCLVVFERVK